MSARIALAAAATAGFGVAAAHAQAPVERPATHTVKKGDTLWDLAATYLGDAYQWPQIYQLNKELIKDPHWIYPDQVFRLPGGSATAPSSLPEPGLPRAEGADAREAMTVFNPDRYRAQRAGPSALLSTVSRTAVRSGDYITAPFMWDVGGPVGSGRLDGTAEPISLALTASLRPIQLREQVLLTMPQGMQPTQGLRLMTYRLGPVIQGQGQVVIPTGVVSIVSASDSTHATGTLTHKFEDVFTAQGLVALDTLAMAANVYPTRVEFGIATRVVWVYGSPALVNEGHSVIFAATSAQGLVPGDQLSLRLSRAGNAPDANADEEIAVAQVTRVTKWGASGIIIDARAAGVAPGVRAQVSAKMP
ncbi:MAG: LysM peptidoglycan-binding domain-containing protein [Gemmatimonadota bacterium]|nr:LysM peptidoglycan-binding domain-containing protein [Gemmatimonadota bacterium]